MKIFSFDTLDSTSDRALRLLQQPGTDTLPFAVISRSQSGGRGRSGKSWSSPEGGIYFTLALNSQDIAEERMAQLPLLAATAVAVWLRQSFGLRVTIKWPNDLLYAGAKLGGILCESSVQGDAWGPITIGVGLNFASAPQVPEQRTTCLREILGSWASADALELARSLAASLYEDLTQRDLAALYAQYAIENGQLWHDANGQWARVLGLDAAGHLQIGELANEKIHNLSSIRHEWQWVYQSAQAQPMLVADVGNSLVKIGVFRDSRQADAQVFRLHFGESPSPDAIALERLLRDLQLPYGWPVHAIAVNEALRERLARWLQERGFALSPVPKRPLAVRFERYAFAELGIDRVAMVEAAHALWPHRGLIVVSAGTAVTVEVLGAEGNYQGGYILPGLQLQLNALHQHTARLPRIMLSAVNTQELLAQDLLGRDTRTAMLRGIIRSIAWTLQGLIEQLGAETGIRSWQLICTGGDGQQIAEALQAPYRPQLILEGVRMMALGGMLPAQDEVAST